MAAATAVEASALDELRFVLEDVFARIEQYERPAPTSLHSLYTALYHQLEDGLMQQEEFEAQRFMALKAWNLKLQLDWVESGSASFASIVSSMLDLAIPKPLFVCVCSHLFHESAGCK